MWKDSMRVALAASLWVVAVLMMVLATVDDGRVVLVGWSVLAALGGSVFVVWQMLICERTRVATIARLIEEQQRRDPQQGLRQV